MSFKTIKTTENVHTLLKLLCAHTGEKQYQVLERLLKLELKQHE